MCGHPKYIGDICIAECCKYAIAGQNAHILNREQERTMIDEKKLISELRAYIDEYSGIDENGMHNLKWCAMMEALELVEQQDSVGDWKLCSEMLPMSNDDDDFYDVVRVKFDNGVYGIGVYRLYDNEWWSRADEGQTYYTKDNKVIAWAYLPDNYSDGREQ